MVIGSPPCTALSQLQGLNNHKRDPDMVKKEVAEACAHGVFCFEVYDLQRRAGRYFMHEHRLSATSWKTECMTSLRKSPAVHTAEAYMCVFGMVSNDKRGPGYAMKPTRLLSKITCGGQGVLRRHDGAVAERAGGNGLAELGSHPRRRCHQHRIHPVVQWCVRVSAGRLRFLAACQRHSPPTTP